MHVGGGVCKPPEPRPSDCPGRDYCQDRLGYLMVLRGPSRARRQVPKDSLSDYSLERVRR
jgi:adenine-specific DNA glycosylase